MSQTIRMKSISITISCILLILAGIQSFAQTPGLIYEPATGAGAAVLDPNGDGYSSTDNGGFVLSDQTESEIPFVPVVFPMAEPFSDIQNGATCGFTDFVDSGTEDPCQQAFTGGNWIFRLRMGGTAPNAKSYSILIDTDNKFGATGPDADPDYSAENPGFEIEIVLATKFGVNVYDVENLNCTPVLTYPGTTNYQKSLALSQICSSTNYFYDFFVNMADITAAFPGVTSATNMRLAIVDNMAAEKSTICNPSSASDVGGVGDCPNLETCFTTIITTYPPCPPGVDCPDRTDCPIISGSYSSGLTDIVGTGLVGASIEVFVNGTSGGTDVVDGSGNWSVTLGAGLTAGDTISASQELAPDTTSSTYCAWQIVVDCPGPIDVPPVITNSSGKNFCGTGIIGYDIAVHYPDGSFYQSNPTPAVSTHLPVDGSNEWVWKCTGNTGGCNAGSGVNCIDEGGYMIFQVSPGGCPSLPAFECVSQGGGYSPGTSQTPSIVASTVFGGATSVDVTVALNGNPAPQSGYIYLFVNGAYETTSALVNAAGTHSVTVSALTACDTLTARFLQAGATGDHDCFSAESGFVTISDTTVAPTITGNFCTTTTIGTVEGLSSEPAGTTIQVYENGLPVGATTTVQADGSWQVTGLSIAPGQTITATATLVACATESAPSIGLVVGTQTTSAVAITSSPITEGDASVSGTGIDGDTIYLYADGYYLGYSTVVSGGTWTISGMPSYEMYPGGVVTATAKSPGDCESAPSASVTVICIPPSPATLVNPDDTTVCSGNVAANITIPTSEAFVVYQLFDGTTMSGSAVLGTGGAVALTSDTLYANTTLKILALKINGYICEDTLTDTVNVIVNAVPDPTLQVNIRSNPVCSGDSTDIYVVLSEVGFTYQLYDSTGNVQVGTSLAGTGDTIFFNTGALTSDSTFYITAIGAAPSSCLDTLSTYATTNMMICASPPVATNDTIVVNEDTTNVIITVQSNDVDAQGDPMTTTIIGGTSTSGGTVTVLNGDSIRYTPPANFNGIDTITYQVCDPGPLCDTALVLITVNPINDTTSKGNETLTITEDDPLTVSPNLIANNTDPDGTATTVTTIVSTSGGGTTGISGAGTTIDYTPVGNFTGIDTVIYTVCDAGTPLPAVCINDTLFVTVNPVNDPPAQGNEALTISEDDPATTSPNLVANNTDPDGTAITVTTVVSTTGGGGTTITGAGTTIDYTPAGNFNGIDTVIYTVCDAGTPLPASCVNDTLFVTVNPVNDPPAQGNETLTITEGDPATTSTNLITNNTDPDTAVTVTTVVSTTGGGGTAITGAGTTIDYTPTGNFNGIDTVIYTVCDAGTPLPAACVNDTLFVTVNPVNDPPAQGNETLTINEDDPATTSPNLVANNVDPDGTTVTVTTVVSTTGGGGTTITGAGTTIDYTPASNFNGIDTVIYTACDAGTPLPAACVNDTLFVTVNPVNDFPDVPGTDTLTTTTPEGTPIQICLTTTTDVEMDALDVTNSFNGPNNGGITGLSDNDTCFTYTPTGTFNGNDGE